MGVDEGVGEEVGAHRCGGACEIDENTERRNVGRMNEMTNKELTELQKKIARLEAELAEVKEMAEVMKKRVGGVFKPEYGQKYWFISARGDVYYDKWDNHPADQRMYAIGNCFPTRQSAEDRVRVLKLIQKARESQNGFVPDWKDETQVKFSLKFRTGDIIIENCHLINTAPIFGYWGDELACERFVEDNHDELIWFFTEYRR